MGALGNPKKAQVKVHPSQKQACIVRYSQNKAFHQTALSPPREDQPWRKEFAARVQFPHLVEFHLPVYPLYIPLPLSYSNSNSKIWSGALLPSPKSPRPSVCELGRNVGIGREGLGRPKEMG